MNTFETIITRLTTQNLSDVCYGVSETSTAELKRYMSPMLVKERIDKASGHNKHASNIQIHTFHIEYDTDKDEFIFCKNRFCTTYGAWTWEEENIEIKWVRGNNNEYNIQCPQGSIVGSVLQNKIPSIFK